MRSSKSRSRSKQNRPRTIGNIVNRVFDSSGPEGKVRGTPQQIIEKYQALARDAQLSNDRVAAENFLQHAEHYTRMLGEAMREMALEQESRRQHQGGNASDRGYTPRRDDRDEDQPDLGAGAYGFSETVEEGESVLVETPETREAQASREQRYDNRRRDENRGQERRDDNRRFDTPRRDDNRRDDNRREDYRREERREDHRRDERRDENRRDERPVRDDSKPYNKRPRREEERRIDEPVVTEAPVTTAAAVTAAVAAPIAAPLTEEPAARPVLTIEKPRAPKPPRPVAEPALEAPMADPAPTSAEGDAAEKPKRVRAPRKPREVKPEAAE